MFWDADVTGMGCGGLALLCWVFDGTDGAQRDSEGAVSIFATDSQYGFGSCSMYQFHSP